MPAWHVLLLWLFCYLLSFSRNKPSPGCYWKDSVSFHNWLIEKDLKLVLMTFTYILSVNLQQLLSKMCLLLNSASFGRIRECFSIISTLHGKFLSRAILISGSEFHLSQKLKFCQLLMSFLHILNASKALPYFLFLFLFLISDRIRNSRCFLRLFLSAA